MRRTVVISNRVPDFEHGDTCVGGLAVGLRAALEQSGGIWLGWSGRTASPPSDTLGIGKAGPFTLATFDLSDPEHARYYQGFANRTLWPLLHGRTDLVAFDSAELATYLGVARKFARHAMRLIERRDLVWVHDYHLIPVAQHLRRLGVTSPLGFFLHTPFPTTDVLVSLRCHRDLFAGLAAYDLIGFQTEADLGNFRDYVVRELGGDVVDRQHVILAGRRIRVGAFPIGIDARHFAALGVSADRLEVRRHLDSCLEGRLAIVGADRLDYTKGIPQRLLAYERLLDSEPGYRGRTSLVQIAAPSREGITEYQHCRSELEALSGRINARYGEFGWTPVRYFNRSFGHSFLAALFRCSRVGLVTPLRDGMNLVAKEYLAVQDPTDPGVLVLSRFAGAAEQLKSAVLVDPNDIGGIARALKSALAMPLDERRARWEVAMAGIREHDIHSWCRSFLLALRHTRTGAQSRAGIRSTGILRPVRAIPQTTAVGLQ